MVDATASSYVHLHGHGGAADLLKVSSRAAVLRAAQHAYRWMTHGSDASFIVRVEASWACVLHLSWISGAGFAGGAAVVRMSSGSMAVVLLAGVSSTGNASTTPDTAAVQTPHAGGGGNASPRGAPPAPPLQPSHGGSSMGTGRTTTAFRVVGILPAGSLLAATTTKLPPMTVATRSLNAPSAPRFFSFGAAVSCCDRPWYLWMERCPATPALNALYTFGYEGAGDGGGTDGNPPAGQQQHPITLLECRHLLWISLDNNNNSITMTAAASHVSSNGTVGGQTMLTSTPPPASQPTTTTMVAAFRQASLRGIVSRHFVFCPSTPLASSTSLTPWAETKHLMDSTASCDTADLLQSDVACEALWGIPLATLWYFTSDVLVKAAVAHFLVPGSSATGGASSGGSVPYPTSVATKDRSIAVTRAGVILLKKKSAFPPPVWAYTIPWQHVLTIRTLAETVDEARRVSMLQTDPRKKAPPTASAATIVVLDLKPAALSGDLDDLASEPQFVVQLTFPSVQSAAMFIVASQRAACDATGENSIATHVASLQALHEVVPPSSGGARSANNSNNRDGGSTIPAASASTGVTSAAAGNAAVYQWAPMWPPQNSDLEVHPRRYPPFDENGWPIGPFWTIPTSTPLPTPPSAAPESRVAHGLAYAAPLVADAVVIADTWLRFPCTCLMSLQMALIEHLPNTAFAPAPSSGAFIPQVHRLLPSRELYLLLGKCIVRLFAENDPRASLEGSPPRAMDVVAAAVECSAAWANLGVAQLPSLPTKLRHAHDSGGAGVTVAYGVCKAFMEHHVMPSILPSFEISSLAAPHRRRHSTATALHGKAFAQRLWDALDQLPRATAPTRAADVQLKLSPLLSHLITTSSSSHRAISASHASPNGPLASTADATHTGTSSPPSTSAHHTALVQVSVLIADCILDAVIQDVPDAVAAAELADVASFFGVTSTTSADPGGMPLSPDTMQGRIMDWLLSTVFRGQALAEVLSRASHRALHVSPAVQSTFSLHQFLRHTLHVDDVATALRNNSNNSTFSHPRIAATSPTTAARQFVGLLQSSGLDRRLFTSLLSTHVGLSWMQTSSESIASVAFSSSVNNTSSSQSSQLTSKLSMLTLRTKTVSVQTLRTRSREEELLDGFMRLRSHVDISATVGGGGYREMTTEATTTSGAAAAAASENLSEAASQGVHMTDTDVEDNKALMRRVMWLERQLQEAHGRVAAVDGLLQQTPVDPKKPAAAADATTAAMREGYLSSPSTYPNGPIQEVVQDQIRKLLTDRLWMEVERESLRRRSLVQDEREAWFGITSGLLMAALGLPE